MYVELFIMKQIVLSVLANAGGVGKSTIAVHLAYEIAQCGYSVALLDLDPHRSLNIFCGLPNRDDPNETIAKVLDRKFDGEWPLVSVWSEKLQLCTGHPFVADLQNDFILRKRSEYILADLLSKYPLPHRVVIIDSPGSLSILSTNSLAASTHVLIPIQLEIKAVAGVAGLIEWCFLTSEELKLDPKPPILGIVPSMVDKRVGMHRQLLEQFPAIAENLQIKLYEGIRESKEFLNASAQGLPIHRYRPSHPARDEFIPIAKDVLELLEVN
jgi:chromosome partitioning protein